MRKLEVVAAVIVVLVIFGTPAAAFGYEALLRTRTPNEYTIVGRDGRWVPSVISVRQGAHVKLRLTSDDVAHGFSVPDLDIDVDEIYPGKWVEVQFVADEPGIFPFFCTVLCNPKHGSMTGEIVVEGISGGAADKKAPAQPAQAEGKAIFQTKCAACHGANGQGGAAGPSVLGIGGDRIIKQVRTPTGNMPPFAPNLLSDQDLKKLVDYLDSLGGKKPTDPSGQPPRSSAPASPPASAPGSAPGSALAGDPASLETGKVLYQTNCAACHGPGAQGAAGPGLVGLGADRVTNRVRMTGGAMPAFPPDRLSDGDLKKLADYIGSLGPKR